MTTAMKILIIGGVLNLVYGFLTGFIIGGIRMKQPTVSKYLTFAHVGPLMQGPILLSLVFALQLSTLSDRVETWAASLLVAGSILLAAKETVNWLQDIKDEFSEKPPIGSILGALSVITSTIGLAIVVVGVFGVV